MEKGRNTAVACRPGGSVASILYPALHRVGNHDRSVTQIRARAAKDTMPSGRRGCSNGEKDIQWRVLSTTLLEMKLLHVLDDGSERGRRGQVQVRLPHNRPLLLDTRVANVRFHYYNTIVWTVNADPFSGVSSEERDELCSRYGSVYSVSINRRRLG
jgi:hypothetical protein